MDKMADMVADMMVDMEDDNVADMVLTQHCWEDRWDGSKVLNCQKF